MKSVTDYQKERIKFLEKLLSDQREELSRLHTINHNLSHVLVYLTDPEFRDFAFNLNYDKLISHYLENECISDRFV